MFLHPGDTKQNRDAARFIGMPEMPWRRLVQSCWACWLVLGASVAFAQQDTRTLVELMAKTKALPNGATEQHIALGEKMLALLDDTSPRATAFKVHFNLGTAYLRHSEYNRASEQLRTAKPIAIEIGDELALMQNLQNLTNAEMRRAHLDAALAESDEGVRLARKLADPTEEWRMLNLRGVIYDRRHELPLALDAYLLALEIVEKGVDTGALPGLLNNIGTLYNDIEEPEKALDFLERSLEILDERDSDGSGLRASLLSNMAISIYFQGDLEGALELHQEAYKLYVEQELPLSQSFSLLAQARILLDLGEAEEALQLAQDSLVLAEQIQIPSEQASALIMLSEIYEALDAKPTALAMATESLTLPGIRERRDLHMSALTRLASVQRNMGLIDEAARTDVQIAALAREIDSLSNQKLLDDAHAGFLARENQRKLQLLEKDKQILKLRLANEEQQGQFLTAGALLSFLLAVVGWRSYLRKRRTERILAVSQRHYETLCNLAPVGFFRCSAEGECCYVNSRWEGLVGMHADSAMGAGWLASVHSEDRERVRSEWRQFVGDSRHFESHYRVLTPTGEERHVLAQALPEFDAKGQLSGHIGCITDLTLQNQLEQHVRESRRLQGIGLLAGGIAHDFNNILSSIMGHASLANAGLAPGERIGEKLDAILRESDAAAKLCSQLLAYAGQGRFHSQELDLNLVVRQVAELLRPSLPAKTKLILELADRLPVLSADQHQLTQVVLNLLSNAREACGAGGGTIRVGTRVQQAPSGELVHDFAEPEEAKAGYLVLTIQDDCRGPGTDFAPQWFDPFYTTKEDSQGLGLAAVLGIVRVHRGAIGVKCKPWKGTTVEIFMPATEHTPAAVIRHDTNLPAPLPGHSVLVVDDNESIRAIATECLRSAGYEVLSAVDGLDALRVFDRAQKEVCLVLLDVMMPQMDGVETLFELRKRSETLPVVLSSGFTSEASMERLGPWQNEFVRFIKKPYLPSELIGEVNQMLTLFTREGSGRA